MSTLQLVAPTPRCAHVKDSAQAGPGTAARPRLVEQHCGELARAQLIFGFHPNWRGQPPAILKGWIDRVFRLGTAYGYPPGVPPEGVPGGLLQARRALVFNTSNTPPERDVVRRMHGPMSGSSAAHRVRWLAGVKALTQEAAALVAAQAA